MRRRTWILSGGGALVCAVASFTFFLSLPRDYAPCGEFFGRPIEQACPPPRIGVFGLDLTPHQAVIASIIAGVVVGGLIGLFVAWAISRRSGERRSAFVLLGIVVGALAGAVYGSYQQVDCMPDGDICVGSFKSLFDRLYPVPIAIALYAVAGLFIGATFGWVFGRLLDREQPSTARTV